MPNTLAPNRVEIATLAALLLVTPLFAQQAAPPPIQAGSVGSLVQPNKDSDPSSAKSLPNGDLNRVFAKPMGSTTVQQTSFDDQSKINGEALGAAIADIKIQLDPPSFLRLTGKVESETMLRRRFIQEAKNRGDTVGINFPEEPVISRDKYTGRHWPRMVCTAEPNYVGYNRLLFQQKNFERYGWDLGALTPIVSAGVFFTDLLFLPYHVATDPFRLYEYNVGYCLPGDPVPLYLYPPEISFTGALAEMGAIVTLVAIFP